MKVSCLERLMGIFLTVIRIYLFIVLLMITVTAANKPLSLKQKKNSIINYQTVDPFQTPKKTYTHDPPYHSDRVYHGSFEIETIPHQKDPQYRREIRTEPSNAFNKKCFQKKRKIVPILHLLERQHRLSSNGSLIKDKRSSVSSRKRGINTFSKSKEFQLGTDRKTIQSKKTTQPESNIMFEGRSMSISRRIKIGIIKFS